MGSKPKFEGPLVGIDFGTTCSRVGYWKDGRIEFITNEQGNPNTPSCVAFTSSGLVLGEEAKNQMILNLSNTIIEAKRLVGRHYADAEVQIGSKFWPFKIVDRNGRPYIQVEWCGQVRELCSEEICAMTLLKLRMIAEEHFGEKVSHAMLTVPSFFNHTQRQAIIDAAAIAGLKVVRLCNETSAALLAMSNKFANSWDEEQIVLIYSLGGGHFTISLAKLDQSTPVIETFETIGNGYLGGRDFDDRLMAYLLQEFRQRHNGLDPSSDPRAMHRLRMACERAKRTLSSAMQASIEIDSLVDGIDFYTTITRTRFEELCMDMFHSTLQFIDEILKRAKMVKGNVDQILLVGGSTRIPYIQRLIREFFNGKEPIHSLDPEEAVLHGTVLRTAVFSQQNSDAIPLVWDCVLLSVGTEVANGSMGILINRSVSTCISVKQIFSTHLDNQTSINIQLFQGNHPQAKMNHFLGNFEVYGIEPAPRRVPRIEVTIDVNFDGSISLAAEEQMDTGPPSKLIVINKTGALPQEEIARMTAEMARNHRQIVMENERIAAIHHLECHVYGLRDRLQERNMQDRISVKDKLKVDSATEQTIGWIESNRMAGIGEVQSRERELEDLVHPIMGAIE